MNRRVFANISLHHAVLIGLSATAWIAIAPQARAQAVPDTIRGRVLTDSGVVISGADVIVTRAPDRTSLFTKTGADGAYVVVFDSATGDYLLHASALGRTSGRKRVTRAGTEHSFVVDFKLTSGVQQMAPVTVSTSKPTPTRRMDYFTETGEAGKFTDGVNAAIPTDLVGDLTATALAMPGVSASPGGVSVLGLGSSQNSVTLNGLAFSGADIPRDAPVRIKTSTSTYDPSRGWFGGLQTNVELGPGNLLSNYHASLLLDAPTLQYGDRTSAQLGQRFTNVQLGVGGSGEAFTDKFAYSFGLNVSHRSSNLVSLLNADPELLQHAGLSADSSGQFASLAMARGIPLVGGASSVGVTDVVSLIARLDHKPYDFNTQTESRQTWGLIGFAKSARSSAVGLFPTASPGYGGRSSQSTVGLQAVLSTLARKSYLTNVRSAISVTRDRTEPYLRVPAGNIYITSVFPDGTGGSSDLSFGGNGILDSDRRQWTWESTSETLFYVSGHATHRVKLDADSRIDGFHEDPGANRLGTFSFNSLADFAANRPSSFTRALSSPVRDGSEWNGFAALGDFWRISQTFQFLYGARVEGNRFLTAPPYNAAIDHLFGARTDNVPNTIHVSPRLGFTWIRNPGGFGYTISPLGQFNTGRLSYFRGGIGEFRTMLPASLLSGPLAANGLPGASQGLTCLGDAVPTPDWSAYAASAAAIPAQCVTAPASLEFADMARTVQLIGKGYTAPRSWRGNLGYSSFFRGVVFVADGTYSLNLNQPGRTDLNFSGAPLLLLNGERRPVFVPAASIVPTTGAVSAVDARKSNQFGRVLSSVSDLRSVSKQLTVALMPTYTYRTTLRVSYTLSSVKAFRSGFDAATFGNPLTHEWARGDLDARHQIQIQAGHVVKGVGITLSSRIQSGLPYTPLVASDVNGDGLANDRAFIFDPASATDAALASATRRLLAGSPARVRRCLNSQLGAAAGLNSCEGPWTAALDAQLNYTFASGQFIARPSIALTLSNSLGAIDQLLHGSGGLHGWGAQAFPDPNLYRVRGFDPTANAFNYEVNPRFGNTNPANTSFRVPFRVTLRITYPLGAPFQIQMVDRWLTPGRAGRPGIKMTAAVAKRRFSRNVNNPYAQILEESDSLLLTPEQVRAIEAVDSAYRIRVDSVWAPFSESLASAPDSYNVKEIVKRMEEITDVAWEMTRVDVKTSLPKILNPLQLKLLPGTAGYLYRLKGRVSMRTYFFGS
jgi:Carboxypeptidase regulatory-like domain